MCLARKIPTRPPPPETTSAHEHRPINPKGPRVYAAEGTPTAWAKSYLGSSVGQKILVGVTGLSLVGFVFFHMVGNLKMFGGPESLNRYAYFLKHDLGSILWIARGGLLALFLTHLGLALWLQLKTSKARPVAYRNHRVAQASVSSRTMLWTGVVTLVFVVFHLAHYTFGLVHGAVVNGVYSNYLDLRDADGYHDVYTMMKAGFETPWISVIYIACQFVLFFHLKHGVYSSLQTLGLVGRRFTPVAKALGWLVAGTILVGNLAIILAVWLKLV